MTSLYLIRVLIITLENFSFQDTKISRYQDTARAVHLYRESNPSLQCRNLAFDQNRAPQVAEKDSKRLMERYGSQRKYSGTNWSGEKLELSVQERRLRWLGHVQRVSDDRIAKQT